jgi:lysophospholipase L1-like esterase
MIESFLEPTSNFYLPDVRIALMTPPPVVISMRKTDAAKIELDHTRRYKDACLSIGHDWSRKSRGKVQIVDCWKAITNAAKGENDDALRPFFIDGVHLTPKAYRVLFEELMQVIKDEWQHLDPANIKATVPVYNAKAEEWVWDYVPKPVQEGKD